MSDYQNDNDLPANPPHEERLLGKVRVVFKPRATSEGQVYLTRYEVYHHPAVPPETLLARLSENLRDEVREDYKKATHTGFVRFDAVYPDTTHNMHLDLLVLLPEVVKIGMSFINEPVAA